MVNGKVLDIVYINIRFILKEKAKLYIVVSVYGQSKEYIEHSFISGIIGWFLILICIYENICKRVVAFHFMFMQYIYIITNCVGKTNNIFTFKWNK